MFYYLSFLRPPPLQAYPSGTVSITPQVANDLRTESFPDAQDIFYAWASESNSSASPTKPLKLTTWRQSSAYKEIPVPLPRGVREGQSWSLILTAQAQGQPQIVDLNSDGLGKTPFPVMSMPILFSSRNLKAMAGKQEQIERVYRFPAASESAQETVYLTVREQTSFDLDKKIWDSGVGLSSWLLELRQDSSGSPLVETLKASLFSPETRSILELGAGSGMVTLTLAALRSAISPLGDDRIISTDLASAMPLLEHNISANQHLFPSTQPQAGVLDWDEDLPDHVRTIEGGFDAIVMADITYNTSSFPSLVRTISSLIRMSKKPPILLLGYKERDPAERSLWDMAKDIDVVFKRVGQRRGWGGAPVEVWIGMVETSDLDLMARRHLPQ